MKTKINNKNKILISLVIFALLFFPFVNIKSESIDELNKLINEKKQMIDDLNNQQKAYQSKIKQKQQESLSLSNEISILNTQISSRELGIKSTELQIDNMNLEIKATELEMQKKNEEIKYTRDRIKTSLQELYQQEEQSNVFKILLLNDNLSDFFDETSRLKSLQSDLQSKVENLQSLQDWLKNKSASLVQSRDELNNLKEQLVSDQGKLQDEQSAKFIFLSNTKNDEKKFNKLLVDLRKEQTDANNLITSYEQKARQLLAQKGGQNIDKNEAFAWPVPSRIVNAYFHDPDYPFRSVFEHPAIDIKAAQGTAIRASASGYVAIAKDNGYGYSYIMIVHNNGLSTVYGHVSQINVKIGDFVLQGDVIGLSGGMPGTMGAGRLTTGPHLHFEMRLNGTPVNPLNYL
jgi:murein DD-endopeptidase MepM/ murein hydrolase activator NlpD